MLRQLALIVLLLITVVGVAMHIESVARPDTGREGIQRSGEHEH